MESIKTVECPWCSRVWAKDEACNWVCCGLLADNKFAVGFGCGKQFCFQCGKKLCTLHFDPETGQKKESTSQHTKECCDVEAKERCVKHDDEYCIGGHNSHK